MSAVPPNRPADADPTTDPVTDEQPAVDGTAADGTPAAPAARRVNPAASAASRARRIGGATGRPAPAATTAAPTTAATTTAASGAGRTENTAGTGSGVSMRKRQPRTTSARALKAEAGSATTVTEVPAWLRWAPAAVLSVCAMAMIVIIAVSAHGVWYAKASTSSARDEVLAAAKKCTALTNTYNYKTLAADEKRGLACTTGGWTAQYRSALEKIVKPTATQLKATQTVDITSAGVESVTGNGRQWTTVVYGQLTINQAAATPRIDPFAAVVHLDKVKSGYLISKIDLVTNPGA